MPSNHLILCRPLLLLPSIFPSIRVFSNESALCIRWPKYWSFSFSICSSKEYLELISFRTDWFDLLEVQGTLESSPTLRSSKASILQHSAFFITTQCNQKKVCVRYIPVYWMIIDILTIDSFYHGLSGKFCLHPLKSVFLSRFFFLGYGNA